MTQIKCVVMDPPWPELGGGRRWAQNHYDLMSVPSIKSLVLEQVGSGNPLFDAGARFDVSDDAHCWMWVTTNYLLEGADLMNALGFTYKRTFVWVKGSPCASKSDPVFGLQIGLGQYARGAHEICLFGSRGKAHVPPPENRPPDVLFAERTRHSEKPDRCFSEWFESVSPGPYLELFARNTRPGWESWGNEI